MTAASTPRHDIGNHSSSAPWSTPSLIPSFAPEALCTPSKLSARPSIVPRPRAPPKLAIDRPYPPFPSLYTHPFIASTLISLALPIRIDPSLYPHPSPPSFPPLLSLSPLPPLPFPPPPPPPSPPPSPPTLRFFRTSGDSLSPPSSLLLPSSSFPLLSSPPLPLPPPPPSLFPPLPPLFPPSPLSSQAALGPQPALGSTSTRTSCACPQ